MKDLATRPSRTSRILDPLIKRLKDPAFSAAYADWIASIVRRASAKPISRHPRRVRGQDSASELSHAGDRQQRR